MSTNVGFKRVSARAIIIKDRNLLTFLRRVKPVGSHEVLTYYSIPGGAVERGESIDEAVRRELKEELSLDIELGPEVAELTSHGTTHHFFLAGIIGGSEPVFNPDSPESIHMDENNSYEIAWIPVGSLTEEMFHWGFELLVPLLKQIGNGKIPETKAVLTES